MARFFIDRPIFAWVVAILIMLVGGISVLTLPIAQYPPVAPPQITVASTFPGASAQTVEDTVTQVIEQQMKGIDHLTYMSSNSDSTGQSEIVLTFDTGADVDIAQIQVQTKLQLALPLLPEEVQRQGVQVTKSTRNYLLVIGLVSEDGALNDKDLGDYISTFILDPLSRVAGVGDVTLFGAQYAMRIWADPDKMEKYKLNPSDIINAVKAQNAQIAGGSIGGQPALPGQQISITVVAQTRLETTAQFGEILIRVNPDGSAVYLKDVARMDLDGENFNMVSRVNGQPAGAIGLKLASGANALETADLVKAELDSLSRFFPPGLKVYYTYDTTPFVKVSIASVFRTLLEAIVLVFFVMYLFLQDFRATIIPTIAVPVVLLGVFGVMTAAGFSINTLTMFGMVLAIGLLVDDAIVVVENVERVMRDEHLSPKEAAKRSMDQITGALIGIAMVLSVVFLPMAFFGGSTGVIYRQFSITIASAMLLSVVIALSLTPALCATILKQHKEGQEKKKWRFFRWFNKIFNRTEQACERQVDKIIKRPLRLLAVYVLMLALMGFFFIRLPTSFLPNEDQGFLFGQVNLPQGASFERTIEVLKKLEHHLLVDQKDAVERVLTIAGFSFSGNGENTGFAFIRLKDWKERNSSELRAPGVAAKAMKAMSEVKEAVCYVFMPPAIMELGTASGFDFEIIDRAGLGHAALMDARNTLLDEARKDPRLQAMRPNGLEDTEQYKLVVDMAKAGALSLDLGTVNDTISAYWASSYINDFMDKGKTKKVYLQADPSFRQQADDFSRYHIRNAKGEMVPFSAFLTGYSVYESPRLERYNGVSSIEILGESAPGQSSGQAMRIMEDLAEKHLPTGIDYTWTGLSYQEKMSGDQAPMLYALSLVAVFLCLAALYESWSIPISVMLVVPLGVIGAVGGVMMRGLTNDVYFQVGLLTIIGLSAKNAILIVEFARELEREGMSLYDATVKAVGMRLRPILMTSFAFIVGVMPLALTTGAGAGSQNAIGTGVAAGMLSATTLGVYFIPIFFVVISRLFKSASTAEADSNPKGDGHDQSL